MQSHSDARDKWELAVRALAKYVEDHELRLKIEVIDHRIMLGAYTLPILSHDPVTKVVEKKRYRVRKVIEESGEQWTSLEFWYRGVGPTRTDCEPTVLIGVDDPGEEVWWGNDGLVERVRVVLKGKMAVEVCWRGKRGW